MTDPRRLLPTVMHSPSRLAILGGLRQVQLADFADVQAALDLTAAELSRQIAILENEGLVEVRKTRRLRRTVTQLRLSEGGRERFEDYLEQLRQVAFGEGRTRTSPA